jgi:uncharacterized protein (TIGR02594 family)
MQKIMMLLLAGVLSACTGSGISNSKVDDSKVIQLPRSNPAFKAAQYLNYTEVTHRQELRELTGVDPKRTEWCAAFVNAVLNESGAESNSTHRFPLLARSFLDWGQQVDPKDIKPGDIVVFPRGNISWQGHVGFYLRTQQVNGVDYYWILGGNQNNKVSIVTYRASKALGIRREKSV